LTLDEKVVRLWDLSTGALRGAPLRHDGTVGAAVFSPDGRIMATRSEGTVRLWDATTGISLGAPMRQDDHVVYALAFSPDGRSLLTGGRDRVARLWDVATCKPKGISLPHPAAVMRASFSKDGTMILTECFGSVRLWSAHTGRPLGPPLLGLARASNATFTRDSRRIFAGRSGREVGLWPVPEPLPDAVEQVQLWVETITGMRLDEHGGAAGLDEDGRRKGERAPQARGGAPGGGGSGGEERRPLPPTPSPRRRGGERQRRLPEMGRSSGPAKFPFCSPSPLRGGGRGEGLLTRSSGLVEAGHDRRDVVLAAPFVRG